MHKTKGSVELYYEYMQKVGDRSKLFELLGKKFEINSALYPGSHIDISPSLYYNQTVYIDNFKPTRKFFLKPDLLNFVSENKLYEEYPVLIFYFWDYREEIKELRHDFDLLISLYAGIVSKYCKKYLRKNGLLIVNNSHGDASMAELDSDFSLIGVINRANRKLYFSQKNLHEYFILKKERKITAESLEKAMKGIGYIKTAMYYLFEKKNSNSF